MALRHEYEKFVLLAMGYGTMSLVQSRAVAAITLTLSKMPSISRS